MTTSAQRILVTALIIFGIWLAGFFGLRTLHALSEVRDHRPPPPFKNETPETDVKLIEDWMTIPFIAKMYHIPPPVIFDALGIPFEGNQRKSIKQINDKYFPGTPGSVLSLVKSTVQAYLPLVPTLIPVTAIPPATAIPGGPP